MADAIIPNKLYVTIQYRKDAGAEDGLLGFASPYTKDAAFEKRKNTQDSWAYGSMKVTIDPEDDQNITVTGEGFRGGYGGGQKWDSAMLFMTNCYPRILSNELIEGFQIAKSVRRWGWGGSGNVKWRITDPRGFDLEISSENFANVLACTTMINGVIQGKCAWGRLGKDNILLPEVSEPYQKAAIRTVQVNTKISLKDIQPGDEVQLLVNNSVTEENSKAQYFGKYFILVPGEVKDEKDCYYGPGVLHFNKRQVERYIFKNSAGKLFAISTPKIVDVLGKIASKLDKVKLAIQITDEFNRDNNLEDIYNAILVSPTKLKESDVTMQLVPITGKLDKWTTVENRKYYSSADRIVALYDGKYWFAHNERVRDTSGNDKMEPRLASIDISELDKNVVKFNYKVTQQNSRWGYGTHKEQIYHKDFKFEDLQLFRIEVTANGITGKVYSL